MKSIMIIFSFIIPITMLPVHSDSEGEDNKGYRSESDTHVHRKNSIVRTTPRPSKKKRRSLGVVFNQDKSTITSASAIVPTRHQQQTEKLLEPTQTNLLIALKYILGEYHSTEQQFTTIKIFETLVNNNVTVNEKAKPALQKKINNFYINYHSAKTKAYFASSERHQNQATTTANDIEKLKLLLTAKRKIKKARKHLKHTIQLIGNDYEQRQQFTNITERLQLLKKEMGSISPEANIQVTLAVAKEKEKKARKHLKMASVIKEDETRRKKQSPSKSDTKRKTLSTGLLYMLAKKRESLNKTNAQKTRNRTYSVALNHSEDLQEGVKRLETLHLNHARQTLIASARDVLESNKLTPRTERKTVTKMIEKAEQADDKIIFITSPDKSKQNDIKNLRKALQEKEENMNKNKTT